MLIYFAVLCPLNAHDVTNTPGGRGDGGRGGAPYYKVPLKDGFTVSVVMIAA